MNNYTDINAKTIDSWITDDDWQWGRPISHEVFEQAKNGDWEMLLTPTRPVPKDWFPALSGCRVLGLASGGGQQMPIFAALGAVCTIMNYSEKQLDSERLVAAREGYNIDVVRGDMTLAFPFADESFDLIFHPVSNCYVKDVAHVWREAYRVLKKGGILLSGMDNGINFMVDDDEKTIANALPFDPLSDPALYEKCMKQNDGVQFSHTIEEQLRGQIIAGFKIIDLYEDYNESGRLAELRIPTFIAAKAVK